MPFSVINHNNKEILFIDHRGLKSDKIISNLKEANQFILKNAKNVLAIADFSDTNGSNELLAYLSSEEEKAVQKFITRQAVVGIKGIKKLFLNLYNKITHSNSGVFDTLEQAKEFVTK